jgi:DNA-binding transcriptional LysR family regulator
VDLKQVEYIVQIAKENNITRAAERLFVTQSALNQQLLKLEKELGTPLFYRSRTAWRPTAAGDVYIKSAYELLRIKKETYSTIYDMTETKKGSITVGLTPERGIAMFSKVYPRFHDEFPDMVITPVELSVRRQQELIVGGELDLGFLTVAESAKPNLRYINLCDEDILLALPPSHPLAKYSSVPYSVLDISKCKEDFFVLMYKESSMRPLIDGIFEAAGFKPKVLFDTSSNNVIITMIKAGLSCGILPHYYTKNQLDNIRCFYLPDYPVWNIVACYRSGTYLSIAAQRLIELASEYWNEEITPLP